MGGGSSKAKNVVEQTNRAFFEAITESVQGCTSNISASQINEIIGAQTATISDINQNQAIKLDFSCLQSANTQTEIDNNFSTIVNQQADSIRKAFGLTSGDTRSQNITKTLNDISTSVKNSFKADCSSSLSGSQINRIHNIAEAAIINKVDQNQAFEAVTKCIQSNSAYQKAVNDLQTQVDQLATSKGGGILPDINIPAWGFIVIGIVILLIVALIGVGLYFLFKTSSKSALEVYQQTPPGMLAQKFSK
jgi:hypothetical protein